MHYRLRMWRADEHQIAWRLHRMALTAQHSCFRGFSIDGVVKKIKEDANLWSLMRGSAGDKDTPTVTLDFDFDWEVGRPINNAWYYCGSVYVYWFLCSEGTKFGPFVGVGLAVQLLRSVGSACKSPQR
eukprot:GHUV01030964.1.p1 GENE.GHUV01030964.1~~GHUV01030964.1.p1  ORF type:complete len:128 (-),score=8.62 GHUV01030964.1:217-600(-)